MEETDKIIKYLIYDDDAISEYLKAFKNLETKYPNIKETEEFEKIDEALKKKNN